MKHTRILLLSLAAAGCLNAQQPAKPAKAFQFADAPAGPVLDELKDAHRVFPGDGVLPLSEILRDLKSTGFTGAISLELYNPNYWKDDPARVARTGLEKTLAVIQKAGV